MNKKKTFVLAILVLLVALISTSSLAWFSAKDEVKNDFLIADSTDTDPEDIFSVDVWEQRDTNGDGVVDETTTDEDAFDYEDILPGSKLSKDVFVENTGHYDQYVRVTVTISDAQAWLAFATNYKAATGKDFDVTSVFGGFDASKWTHVWNNLTEVQNPTEIVYVLYYIDALEEGDKINVFNTVNIPTELTQEDAAKFGGGFSVTVKAEAVQTENVGAESVADVDKAWTAFKTVTEG